MFVDTMTNKAYLEIANSPMLWAMVIPTVLAMCVQAYVFIKDAVKAGPIVGLTKEDTKTAIKAGCICSFGPGMSMFTVMIAFMAIMGGPFAWLRLSIIGTITTEMLGATAGATALGVELGGPDYGIIGFANSVWVITLNTWGFFLVNLIFAHRIEKFKGFIDRYAWCDIFTDWCFIQTFGLELDLKLLCQAKKGVGAGCSGSANYYKQKGQFHTSGPQPGDQIFFTNDGGKTMYHTGIVEKVAGGRVYTIEGNTSSAAGVVENGGCVRDKSYALTYSKIGGYGRPDFSIVPEEDDDMDQNKFNEMFKVAMTAHQKELQDNDCGEWSREAREWAIRVGLFAGNGTTADGQPNYMWASPLTREQAAQLFYRFAQDHGLA